MMLHGFFRRALRVLMLLFWGMLLSGPLVANPLKLKWPQLTAPPDSQQFWIAEYVEQNTVPMNIRGFVSALSSDDVLSFYRKWFAEIYPEGHLMEQDLGESNVLSLALKSDYALSVQVRTASSLIGSSGRLVVAYLGSLPNVSDEQREQSIGRGFPFPIGSKVLSETVSYDGDIHNRTLLFENTMSVETNALSMREELLGLGWILQNDKTLRGGIQSSLTFRRNSSELNINITYDSDLQKTMIVSSQTSYP